MEELKQEEKQVTNETVDSVLAGWRLSQYQSKSKELDGVLPPVTQAMFSKFFVDNFDLLDDYATKYQKKVKKDVGV